MGLWDKPRPPLALDSKIKNNWKGLVGGNPKCQKRKKFFPVFISAQPSPAPEQKDPVQARRET
jgi:hypothetical protein